MNLNAFIRRNKATTTTTSSDWNDDSVDYVDYYKENLIILTFVNHVSKERMAMKITCNLFSTHTITISILNENNRRKTHSID